MNQVKRHTLLGEAASSIGRLMGFALLIGFLFSTRPGILLVLSVLYGITPCVIAGGFAALFGLDMDDTAQNWVYSSCFVLGALLALAEVSTEVAGT